MFGAAVGLKLTFSFAAVGLAAATACLPGPLTERALRFAALAAGGWRLAERQVRF
jgi:hypothetical protein